MDTLIPMAREVIVANYMDGSDAGRISTSMSELADEMAEIFAVYTVELLRKQRSDLLTTTEVTPEPEPTPQPDQPTRPGHWVLYGEKDVFFSGGVAKIFGVSSRTVTYWAKTGKLPYIPPVMPRGRLRFYWSDVEKLAEKLGIATCNIQRDMQ